MSSPDQPTGNEKDLPLMDNGTAASDSTKPEATKPGRPRRWLIIPALMLLFALGGIIGLYFQPPGLKLFFGITGLEPGGGNANPIAVPAPKPAPTDAAQRDNVVIALGRLMPFNDVITIAPPYGAGDARIQSIEVNEGDYVQQGQVIATLDNEQTLQAALENARTSVDVRTAELNQTETSIRANYMEALASFERAVATEELANQDLARGEKLRAGDQLSRADLERLQASAKEARSESAKAKANLSRYEGIEDDKQADILLAKRNLENAEADLKKAQADLDKARVIAVSDGQVLAINARRGERPGEDGIATLGNTDQMEVELEVYQQDVANVAVGQTVEINSAALGDTTLKGTVVSVGLEVKRQQLVDDDPAANTDARVVLVRAILDRDSSNRAATLTGLQVTGTIQVL